MLKQRLIQQKAYKYFILKKLANGQLCVSSIIKKLYELKYQKILIEGGAKTASSFLNKGLL